MSRMESHRQENPDPMAGRICLELLTLPLTWVGLTVQLEDGGLKNTLSALCLRRDHVQLH